MYVCHMANKSIFIFEKIIKYRKCPAMDSVVGTIALSLSLFVCVCARVCVFVQREEADWNLEQDYLVIKLQSGYNFINIKITLTHTHTLLLILHTHTLIHIS